MYVIERAKDMLLKPKDTWAVIDTEHADTAGLYTRYLMILALVPAVCTFIGMSLIGLGAFGVTIRVPLLAGLANLVVSYVMSLAGVFVLGLVINALAPTFGGSKSPVQALKVAVYASTAAMLGGVFGLVPALAVLGLVAALYSLYLLYLGLPVLMKSAPDKALPYTVVVVVAAIVLSVVVSYVGALFMPHRALWGEVGDAASVAVHTPKGQVTLNTAGLEAANKKMEEAARQMEQAQKSQDPAAMAAASGQVMAAAASAMAGSAPALGVQSLKAALPDTLLGLPRTRLEAHDGAAMGIASSQASAEYGSGDKLVRVSIVDAPGLGQLAQLAGAMQGEKETATQVEKIWQEGSRTLQQNYEKDGSQSEFKVILKNGVIVSIEAEHMVIKDVHALMGQIDLPGLESLQRKPKP